MKELAIKFAKYSAAQLIQKMEKGAINEDEKNVIITILKNRGKDVQPYMGKTPEEIKADAEIDKAQLKEAAKAMVKGKTVKTSPKTEKVEKAPKVKKEKVVREGKTKRVRFDDEVFKVDVTVTTDIASSRLAVGQKAVVKSCFYMDDDPEKKFATLKNDEGLFLARKLDSIKVVE